MCIYVWEALWNSNHFKLKNISSPDKWGNFTWGLGHQLVPPVRSYWLESDCRKKLLGTNAHVLVAHLQGGGNLGNPTRPSGRTGQCYSSEFPTNRQAMRTSLIRLLLSLCKFYLFCPSKGKLNYMLIKYVKNKLDMHSSSPPIVPFRRKCSLIFCVQSFVWVRPAPSRWNACQWGYNIILHSYTRPYLPGKGDREIE